MADYAAAFFATPLVERGLVVADGQVAGRALLERGLYDDGAWPAHAVTSAQSVFAAETSEFFTSLGRLWALDGQRGSDVPRVDAQRFALVGGLAGEGDASFGARTAAPLYACGAANAAEAAKLAAPSSAGAAYTYLMRGVVVATGAYATWVVTGRPSASSPSGQALVEVTIAATDAEDAAS